MLKRIRTNWTVIMMAIVTLTTTVNIAHAKDSIKEMVGQYRQAATEEQKLGIVKKLGQAEPATAEDANELRVIFNKKDYDENLFDAAIESVKKITDKNLDTVLIDILRDEKTFVEKAGKKDFQGKSEGELARRGKNIMLIIMKLGEFKSQNAVSILREYLNYSGIQYYASEALVKIGDRSAGAEMKERAYRGEEVNYGGLGLDEAIQVIKDLEDKNKKDQWPKIAKQIINIKNPGAKSYLKNLMSHEKDYVRAESAMVFANIANETDVADIAEMTQSKDWFVRCKAIDVIKKLRNQALDDILINLLLNDPHRSPRSDAAKALGYKKISKAVPYLEKALNDKDLWVRQEAFIALYILTDNKYDFKGRDVVIEQKAEREKLHPSFY